jgi:hypothetical protein
MVNIDKLKQILDRQDVFVKFTKKNGEERVMRCTRSVHLIPKDQLPKGIGIVKDGVTPVYDLDNDGWRSFSNDSVISYEFTEMQNDFDVFFNRVLEEAHKAPLPELYIARYLESFIRLKKHTKHHYQNYILQGILNLSLGTIYMRLVLK